MSGLKIGKASVVGGIVGGIVGALISKHFVGFRLPIIFVSIVAGVSIGIKIENKKP